MASNQHEAGGHHIVPAAILGKVAVALLVLTGLTVGAAQMHLGALEAPVAILIALVKAFLVMAFFMGLKYDTKMNRAIFLSGFAFLALLFLFCALDIHSRVNQISTL